jgi:hypothetical protein
MTGPLPDGPDLFDLGQEPQPDGFVGELEHESRFGAMHDAELVPVGAIVGDGLAEVRHEAVAQLADGDGGLGAPAFEQGTGAACRARDKSAGDQGHGGFAREEPDIGSRHDVCRRGCGVRGRGGVFFAVLEGGLEAGELALEPETPSPSPRSSRSGLAPLREPAKQVGPGQAELIAESLGPGVRFRSQTRKPNPGWKKVPARARRGRAVRSVHGASGISRPSVVGSR